MKFTLLASVAALVGLAAATPTPTVEKRATTFCGQWDSLQTGGYTIYNNLWGKDSATSGSQCTTVDGMSSSKLVWSVTWSWQGGPWNVKSYPNAVRTITQKQLSAVSSIPTTWTWSYTGSSLIANVAYDLFTSSTTSGSAQYEIMIWLGALGGAGPISSTGSPIATPSLAGRTWNLFYGLNGSMKVYSFVAQSQATNFSGDLKQFVTYLASNQGFPTSQYLQSAGAGTEPFTGTNGVFKTTGYTLAVN